MKNHLKRRLRPQEQQQVPWDVFKFVYKHALIRKQSINRLFFSQGYAWLNHEDVGFTSADNKYYSLIALNGKRSGFLIPFSLFINDEVGNEQW